jgi:hypothetical protein
MILRQFAVIRHLFAGVTDAPHSKTKLFGGKKSAGAAKKRAADQYLIKLHPG